MRQESIFHQMENWGYYLLPRFHELGPGNTGLLVAIRETPTKMHFDPDAIHLRLRDQDGIANWTKLDLRGSFRGSRHVCPGHIVLSDRLGKQIRFYVFGGSLEASSIPGETVYSLRSPAPILLITESPRTIPNLLASETEVILGGLQARWESDQEGFLRRLASIDSLQFYQASLCSIGQHCTRTEALQEVFEELCTALQEEEHWLKESGRWLIPPPSLETLLAPG